MSDRMRIQSPHLALPRLVTVAALASTLAACNGEESSPPGDSAAGRYVLASVVLTDTGRTTYVQVLPDLPSSHVDNSKAIEFGGNGVILARGRDVFVGLAEEPTWVRYSVGDDGQPAETGRLSFAGLGLSAIDYGNVIVDKTTAVSVSSAQLIAIVWNPETMEIVDTVDLSHMAVDGYALEVWTTVANDGLVYIPGRWANWEQGSVLPKVMTTILDPVKRTVVGVAEDDRCASGGRATLGEDGYTYVMGDGRNYAIQMYANALGEPAPKNCLLRIAPGATDFEADWVREIPALGGGHESATELETAAPGSKYAFTKLFYPEELPEGVEPVSFDFWSYPVFKNYRLTLADEPSFEEVKGLPFSSMGFTGSPVGGKLYSAESPDYATSVVYEIDPETNSGVEKFTMDGSFNLLHELE
jgi:hypothetical protein